MYLIVFPFRDNELELSEKETLYELTTRASYFRYDYSDSRSTLIFYGNDVTKGIMMMQELFKMDWFVKCGGYLTKMFRIGETIDLVGVK